MAVDLLNRICNRKWSAFWIQILIQNGGGVCHPLAARQLSNQLVVKFVTLSMCISFKTTVTNKSLKSMSHLQLPVLTKSVRSSVISGPRMLESQMTTCSQVRNRGRSPKGRWVSTRNCLKWQVSPRCLQWMRLVRTKHWICHRQLLSRCTSKDASTWMVS